MLISKSEFDSLLKNNKLHLSLVGMSNVGKTRRAKSLIADTLLNFTWLNGDDLVEAKLKPWLEGKGFHGINGVAEWMGQPYEGRYHETQRLFIKFEEESMNEINYDSYGNLVVDTTGSVIYLSKPAVDRLKQNTLIVYLEADENVKKVLFERYISNPKPVVWGDSFKKLSGESDMGALKRCYPSLLEFRASRYKAVADVIIPHSILRDSTGQKFLDEIKKRLP